MSISAMKQALEALALFASDESDDGQMAISAYETLRQAIAEAENQKPVAFVSGLYNAPVHASDISQERVDETAKDKHEDWYGQHQWQCGYERGWDAAMEKKENSLPLMQEGKDFTVSKPWVGLTDEEVMLVMDDVLEGGGWLDVARAIEAKLKEKNMTGEKQVYGIRGGLAHDAGSGSFVSWDNTKCNPLAPAREQARSAWEDGYASAKREWVSIPDWEIHEMYNEPKSDAEMIAFAREFEAKLKEKNSG